MAYTTLTTLCTSASLTKLLSFLCYASGFLCTVTRICSPLFLENLSVPLSSSDLVVLQISTELLLPLGGLPGALPPKLEHS